MAPLPVHHLDLYVLGLIADREIERESYLILRVVSGPQHCELYDPDAKLHVAFFLSLRHCIAFVSSPQEDDESVNIQFKKWKRAQTHPTHGTQCPMYAFLQ